MKYIWAAAALLAASSVSIAQDRWERDHHRPPGPPRFHRPPPHDVPRHRQRAPAFERHAPCRCPFHRPHEEFRPPIREHHGFGRHEEEFERRLRPGPQGESLERILRALESLERRVSALERRLGDRR